MPQLMWGKHAMMELKKFVNILHQIMAKVAQLATSPEEKQYLQQVAQQLQQEIR